MAVENSVHSFGVLIPIAKPGIIVCAIFSFLYAWGDLAYSMTFILDQQARPITAGIYNFMGQYGTKWSYLTAYAIVTIIPVALHFHFHAEIYHQRHDKPRCKGVKA